MTETVRADGCVFCRIVAGTAPATVVGRWPAALGIVPVDPVTVGHTLVVPTRHVTDVSSDPVVSSVVMMAAARLAARYAACNIITSKGLAATQTVPHLHLHVVPRRSGDGLPLPWTPRSGAGEVR